MERILVIQLKRIGDFLLTVPALAVLRQERPLAEIVLLVQENVAGLAQALPMVDRVISYKQGKLNLKAWASMLAGPWAACFDFGGTDRSALLTKLTRAKQRIGYRKFAGLSIRRLAYTKLCKASVRDLHTVDFHLALIREWLPSLSEDIQPISFVLSAEVKQGLYDKLNSAGLQPEQRYAIIHPGTARTEKFWLNERWAQVAEYIHREMGLQIVLTGSGVGLEEVPLAEIKHLCSIPFIDLTGKLSLLEMTAVIAGCDFIVGVDSMAMHMAYLLQKPQIALFGPTNPYHWRSKHAKSVVIGGEKGAVMTDFLPKAKGVKMNKISTEAVIGAITCPPVT